MKLVKPSFEIIEQEPGFDGLLRHIELCGRTCYKSENKITEDSAPKFVDMLVNRGHTAMVEHGTVYMKYDIIEHGSMNFSNKYHFNKYSVVTINNEPLHGYEIPEYKERFNGHIYAYITTNYRVLLQNDWFDDLKYQCKPTEHHIKRITVKFVCDRGVTAEANRHRTHSIAEMSTRYVAFDKRGGEVSIIQPCWISNDEINSIYTLKDYCSFISGEEDQDLFVAIDYWLFANLACEYSYLNLRRLGWQAQQARGVLPLDLQTELIHTATVTQWKEFFKLRCDKQHAHPQIYELAKPLEEEFIKRGWLQEV